MIEFLARLFGSAAVVGWLTTFRKRELLPEIDPHTGRETLYSIILRRQRELSTDPWKAWR